MSSYTSSSPRPDHLAFILIVVHLLSVTLRLDLEALGGDPVPSAQEISPRVRALLAQLDDPSAERCIQAAEELDELGPSAASAIPRLVDLLDDSRTATASESVGDVASRVLARMGKEAVVACVSAYKMGRSAEHREMLELTASRFQDLESIDALIDMIHDSSSTTRCYVINLVGKSKDPRIGSAVLNALQDTDDGVRGAAAKYFQTHRDERVVQPLLEAVSDECESVRFRAILALGYQRDPAALPVLNAILTDPTRSVMDRCEAAKAVGSIGSPDGFETLVRFAQRKGSSPSVRRGAITGLGELRDPRGYELLLDIFKDRTEGDDERACAAEALLKIDPDSGKAEATRVAIDESERPYLRFWTAVFLVKATDGSVADVGVVEALKCYRFERRRLVIDSTWEAAFDALLAVSENGRTPQVRSLARKELSTMHELLPDEFEWNGQVVSSTQDSLEKLAQHKDVWRIACCGYYLVVALLWFPLHRRVVNARRGTVYSILILAILAAVGTPLVLLAI